MSDADNSTAINAPIDDAMGRFSSFTSLQDAHGELLQRRRESGDTPDFLGDVAAFIRRGRATGVLLDVRKDRRASQSLLDYWVNTLYRASGESFDATLAEFDPTLAPELDEGDCPYRGLDAFREIDHDVFFGRQRLVEEMIGRIEIGQNRLLAVVGPSGSGKSSLVLAGLLPALKANEEPSSRDWHYYQPMVPGSNPLAKLAQLLRPSEVEVARWDEQQIEYFQQDPAHLAHLVDELNDKPVVLVVDQFEEIFTLCLDDDVRQTFVENLLGLIQTPRGRHTVILTMRTDFEPYVAGLGRFQPLLEGAIIRVFPLSAEELREAIEKPAEQVNLRFEEGVVDALLQDILGSPAALPLLQFTLLKLWENRERNRVTWAAYRRLGGGREALERSADEFYERLSLREDKETVRYILLRMVRLGEGLEVTSSRIRRETLYQGGPARDRVERVLGWLVKARLVRLTEGETPADAQVEVAHEALVRNWHRLVEWLKEAWAAMATRQRLEAKAREWVRLGQGGSGLLDEVELLEAERWLEGPDAVALGYDTMLPALVRASRVAQRKTALFRYLVGVLIAVLTIALLIALAVGQSQLAQQRQDHLVTAEVLLTAEVTARTGAETAAAAEAVIRQTVEVAAESEAIIRRTAEAAATAEAVIRRTAEAAAESEAIIRRTAEAAAESEASARQRAEQQYRLAASRALAAAALDSLGVDPERGVLLALEAVSITYIKDRIVTDEAEDALHRAIQASRVRLALLGHTDAVLDAVFGPDGTRLATASADGTAKVWDALSGKELVSLVGHEDMVTSIAFSPDGALVATASADKTAKVWDAISGDVVHTLVDHGDWVTSVTFSPNGTRLVTTSRDKTAKVWSVETGEELVSFPDQEGWVMDVAFSPDGTRLVTSCRDGTVRVWDASTGEELDDLSGHEAAVWSIAFSLDGTYLGTASEDLTAKVWDVSSGRELRTLSGHTNSVFGVAFSQTNIATASADGTAKIWKIGSEQALYTLFGHDNWLWGVDFSPDGTRLVTASQDGTARVWNISPDQELLTLSGHGGWIMRVAFSPDGTRLVTAGADGTALAWDVNSGDELMTLTRHAGAIRDVVFSPDGTCLATASEDGTAKVWDIDSGRVLLTISSQAGEKIPSIAFSPDGARLATASEGKTAKVWDVDSGRELVTLSDHVDRILSIAFSPDGRYLATASLDGTAKVWNADSGEMLRTLSGHTGIVLAVSFSPDGTHLATAGADGRAVIWDRDSGEVQIGLSGHTSRILDIAFSPDGTRVATASLDGTTKVWDAASGKEQFTLSGHMGGVQSIAFNTEQTRLATSGRDGTVRIYALNIDDLIPLACSRVTRNLTEAEWETYFEHDVDYRQTCPNLPVHPSVVEAYVRQGKVDEALAALRKAVELDPTLDWTPETKVAGLLVEYGKEYARHGKIEDALTALRYATELDSQIEFSQTLDVARAYYSVCWWGSLDGQAEKVLSVCERAVELVPYDGAARDARGLARALTGDYAGAIEDFRFFVEWSKEPGSFARNVPWREAWIVELEAGRNPFDEATLEDLHVE